MPKVKPLPKPLLKPWAKQEASKVNKPAKRMPNGDKKGCK